nr:hypothetical protein Iba_scaffold31264CG0010 [Ipomoea batatas]GMD81060.1 hypothetical protein Iba_scaffold1570468CG0010 [Ipomoea batatas]GME03747.1 hypothetical protein Iba_scaffold1134CG0070 [Ipomoea batatas]
MLEAAATPLSPRILPSKCNNNTSIPSSQDLHQTLLLEASPSGSPLLNLLHSWECAEKDD